LTKASKTTTTTSKTSVNNGQKNVCEYLKGRMFVNIEQKRQQIIIVNRIVVNNIGNDVMM
jgi:hypothetical protein